MDFGSKDVLQFAMMVVEFIEHSLPLPPFELWAEDFLDNQEALRPLYPHPPPGRAVALNPPFFYLY